MECEDNGIVEMMLILKEYLREGTFVHEPSLGPASVALYVK